MVTELDQWMTCMSEGNATQAVQLFETFPIM